MIKLTRTDQSAQGTFGILSMNDIPLCVTCELPNPIPEGTYACIPHNGPEHKDVWEIIGVPGHSAVLIHEGNTILDTKLCVLVGNGFGTVKNLPAVIASRNTLDFLRIHLPKSFSLTIKGAYNV